MRRNLPIAAALLVLACGCLSGNGRRYIRPRGEGLPAIVAPTGRRVWVAAQAALDARGRIVEKDLASQVRRAVANIRAALAKAGSNPSELVRLDVHLLEDQDPAAARRALLEEFPAAESPNVLIVPVGALPWTGALVQIAAEAAGEPSGTRSGVVRFGPSAAMAQGRPVLYLSGQSDAAIGRHEPISDMAELMRRSMEGLAIALRAGGTGFDGVGGSTIYISSLEQLDKARRVYSSYFPGGQVPPTSWVAHSATDGASPWVEVDVEAVAGAGASAPAKAEFINPPGLAAYPVFTYVVRPAPGRAVYIGAQTAAAAGDPRAQAHAVYRQIDDLLRAAGGSFENVTKMRVFLLPSGGVMPAVNEVRAKYRTPGRAPASMLLGWDAMGETGAVLQADAVAVLPAQ